MPAKKIVTYCSPRIQVVGDPRADTSSSTSTLFRWSTAIKHSFCIRVYSRTTCCRILNTMTYLTQHSSSVGVSFTSSRLFSLTLPVSTTKTTSSIVIDVSAISVRIQDNGDISLWSSRLIFCNMQSLNLTYWWKRRFSELPEEESRI